VFHPFVPFFLTFFWFQVFVSSFERGPMRAIRATTACLFAGAVIVMLGQSPARPQGSGSSRTAPPRETRPPTPEEFHDGFWRYLNRNEAPYKKWAGVPGKTGMQKGEGPHGEFTKTYLNKVAAEDFEKLPLGAILVTENYDKDKKTLQGITVMYRSKGADPKRNDWYWLRYLPNGSIARTSEKEGKKPIAGKVASCIDCHTKAGGSDFVFSNDAEPEPMPASEER
jgi:hypothetical protein